jgi:hypothetical protein
MKNFILFLCKTFKVRLVEPHEQILKQLLVHEKVPYTLVQSTVKLDKYSLPNERIEEFINQAKKDMAHKCLKELVESNLLTFTQFEDYMGTINLRCSFYAAPTKQDHNI